MMTGLQSFGRDWNLPELLPLSHVYVRRVLLASAWGNGGGQEDFSAGTG